MHSPAVSFPECTVRRNVFIQNSHGMMVDATVLTCLRPHTVGSFRAVIRHAVRSFCSFLRISIRHAVTHAVGVHTQYTSNGSEYQVGQSYDFKASLKSQSQSYMQGSRRFQIC